MSPASRDGRPEKKKQTDSKRGRPGQSKGAQSRRSQSTDGESTDAPSRGASAKGAKAKGSPAKRAAARRAQTQRAQPKRPHRKGSTPNAKTGAVRLNNAKPAKHQYVNVPENDGAAHHVSDGVRLQKVLAQAGVASRRGAEELIAAGRVDVNGEIVTEQGLRIDTATAIVRVDGARVTIDEDMQYLALNKPKGWQSTMSDEQGRPCIGDLVAERVMAGQRLFHVGRLDADTEGLLLLTTDGELAHRLMHPSYKVPKTYLVSVRGEVRRPTGRQLKDGIELDDGPAKADKFTAVEVYEGKSLVEITLHEGRNRIVRRMFEHVGHPVTRLVRTDIGAITLGDQRPGSMRALNKKEIGALYKAVGM